MQELKKPYELLVRWRQDGTLQAAHVQWATLIINDDGTIAGWYPGDIQTVDVGKGGNFPLADILSDVQSSALVSLAAEQEKSAALEDQVAALSSQLEAAQAEGKTATASTVN
jgi:hypothetical protein